MMGRSGGMNEAMRQAARLQRKIEQVREEAKGREVSFATVGDKARATVTCDGRIKQLVIDPGFIASEGHELARDALVAAINGALDEADKVVEAEVAKVTGGLKLPGM
jgi:DNA-binding protein YbaB